MKIEEVYISCYKLDVHLTRICVASIRFWYPDIPIWLIKDEKYGRFSTKDIEKGWNVGVFAPEGGKNFGWGMGKYEVFFLPKRSRVFLIDSDIVFAGRVLDELEMHNEDFIVHKEPSPCSPESMELHYFSVAKLRSIDPTFRVDHAGCFNGGQIVATTGILQRDDFARFIDWRTRAVLRPDVFKMGEQGLLNYILQRKQQDRALSIAYVPFMIWPGREAEARHIRVDDLVVEGRWRQLIHWAGLRWGRSVMQMPRADILQHFERMYYSRLPFGSLVKLWRQYSGMLEQPIKIPVKLAARALGFK
jgi:hypothetical protein